METTTKNYVFISYNHKDVKWAQWLQKKLEWYRLPTEMHNKFSDSRYLRPVFRDRDTLTAGVLNDELRNHLESSNYLVVICSPNSAQSEWVSNEVKAFIDMGRLDKIVPFIVDGKPQDYSHGDVGQPLMGECFPLALRQWNTEHPDKNLLGIAVSDDGKADRQKAFIRLVAHLLGVEFDTLWQRHKRYLRKLLGSLIALAVIALALAYWFMIPIRLYVAIVDEHCNLPGMEHAVLTVNGSEYSLSQPDTIIEVGALPGYCRLRSVPMSFHANRFYTDISEQLDIGMGISQQVSVQLHRDTAFAIFAGTVYDGDNDHFENQPIEGATIAIGNQQAVSNARGQFRIEVPLSEQRVTQSITIEKKGYHSHERTDESPNEHLQYLLHKSE